MFKVSKKLASKLGFILSQSNELHIKVEVESTSNKEFKNKKAVFFNFNNLNQFKLFFSGRKLIKNDSVKNRRFWYYLFITNEPFEISEKFDLTDSSPDASDFRYILFKSRTLE